MGDGTAVVTGASRGLGRAIALELARRGLDVVATMRDPTAGAPLLDEAATAGLSLRVEHLDVTRPAAFAVPEGLRVLVNSAAVRHRYLPIEETPLEEWHDTFATNVFGLAELTRRCLPAMRRTAAQRPDVVVCNVTSAAILLPHPFMGTYRASKAAVSALCDSLRLELLPLGIRVVEILPGPIGTDLQNDSVMVRLPEAVEHPPYRALGERQHEVSAAALPYVTAPAAAATAIADAVLDTASDAPMRYGCDPVAVEQLAHWRVSSDETLAAEVMGRLGVGR
jgi:NAD(P)-dependent dehydrogenase (short-subunit alcohol dehydrogenase family)